MEFFPCFPSALSFPEPLSPGPLLLYLEPTLPPFPHPGQSLSGNHLCVRPLLLRVAFGGALCPFLQSVTDTLLEHNPSSMSAQVHLDCKPGEGSLSQEALGLPAELRTSSDLAFST